MINIKVLGSGCANCKRLEMNARKALENLGIQAEIEKVTEFDEIMKWQIISTPGLVIDGKVVSSGRVPSDTEIAVWLKQA